MYITGKREGAFEFTTEQKWIRPYLNAAFTACVKFGILVSMPKTPDGGVVVDGVRCAKNAPQYAASPCIEKAVAELVADAAFVSSGAVVRRARKRGREEAPTSTAASSSAV